MDNNFFTSVNYEVYANGNKVVVHEDILRSYDIKTLEDEIYKTVWDKPSFVIFSIDAAVNFEVKCNKPFRTLKIRPLSANIEHHVVNNSIYFTMEKPQKISLEFDNNLSEPLILLVAYKTTKIGFPSDCRAITLALVSIIGVIPGGTSTSSVD